MRYRVELQFGYVSYDESKKDVAWALYEREGVRIFECADIYDEGTLLAGPPVVKDLESEARFYNAN